MSEYIDRDALIKDLHQRIKESHSCRYALIDEDFIDIVKDSPKADVVEVRHGEWIGEIVKRNDWRGKEQSYYQPNSCSLCHIGFSVRTNFCPNCGAKMDGKEV